MLGRKTYTRDELDHVRAAVAGQLAAYRRLAEAVDAAGDPRAQAALEAFEPRFAEALTLALDRSFVHRLRAVAGKDGNPLNEVAVLAESLLVDGGAVRPSSGIKLDREQAVLGLAPGDAIALSAADFERLAEAFLGEIEARFVAAGDGADVTPNAR
jgi:hypothetical protein